MNDQMTSQNEQRNPLIPVKSIADWRPDEKTVASIIRVTGIPQQDQLRVYRELCGQDHQQECP
jgi:hypothetical protein